MSISLAGLSGAAHTMAVGGASISHSPQQKMTNLYNSIDTAGSGSISKNQLSTAFATMNPPTVFKNAGVDAVFSQLDPSGTGNVSKSNFIDGMKSLMVSLRASTDELNSIGG